MSFFVSVFARKTSLQESHVPETRKKNWSKEDVPLVEENQVRTYFTKLDIHKLTDSGGMHSRALKKLLGHSIIFDWPW